MSSNCLVVVVEGPQGAAAVQQEEMLPEIGGGEIG